MLWARDKTLDTNTCQRIKAGVIYSVIDRQHNNPERFITYFQETVEKCIVSEKWIYRLNDANSYESCKYAEDFLYILQTYSLATTDKPTRIQGNSVMQVIIIFVNSHYEANRSSGNCIMSDISDHFTQICLCKLRREKVIPSQVKICG